MRRFLQLSQKNLSLVSPTHFDRIKTMAVIVDVQNTGDPNARTEVVALIEHALCDREGEWRVSIVGSRATTDWEMKVEGPRGFERAYTLLGPDQHQLAVIRDLLLKLLR